MKISLIALLSSIISADAANFRDLVEKVTRRNTGSATTAETATAAETATDIEGADQENRDLQRSGCWGNSGSQVTAWHPQYSAGWTEGYCRLTVDCNSPSYSTQLACCKAAYAGQMSGYCLMQLPSPPTMSPTESGGLGVFYPDYDTAWTEAGCVSSRPMPSGRPVYSTMLSCCKGAYGGQVSGKCLSELPSPPTTSPSTSAFEADFWYPDYETTWSEAGCSNKLPLPYKYKGDRPNYSTQVACCKGAYAGQMSGKCLSELPSPPTMAPTGAGGAGFYYPDYDTAWSEATCRNTRPVPFGTGGRPTYSTMLACCKGAYGGQMSGTCLANLPSPPTQSPTGSGGLSVFYPNYEAGSWQVGTCIDTRPLPSGRPSYSTQEACCSGAYGGQRDHACMCDAVGVCYSCSCGSASERLAATCDIDCD
eukprot:CAMPEP_0201866540 /NCGR_PEP_ID=MMETSP0902-20130614/1091_1 /ASSEMBLY_ACC=CAM_ASM_000551 /TAXON_ID=420261 /ORGANISM="Thalassiosira antarctica, Strain CCMP982" /LENGTH=421 /DNA_ID=CAMNT_0048391529 /DNA_START=115 /DNA_END=1380 /DNA_ORIENTATION=-